MSRETIALVAQHAEIILSFWALGQNCAIELKIDHSENVALPWVAENYSA